MQCTIDNCERDASYTFVWPWGDTGSCCQDHVVIVQQKARNARGRFGQVSFTALDPHRPVEITRNERVELQSARLVAEAEAKDAQIRASKLFEANTNLSKELRAMRARAAQYEADIKALRINTEVLVRERDAAMVTADKLREEMQRFGVFEEHTPAEVPHPHVVE